MAEGVVIPFREFFVALHGRDPFPWQVTLAERVAETQTWPATLGLPTGSGKTACIDVALHHLATASIRGRPQDAARRIVFVVDRRIIVDEAQRRAERIRRTLAAAADGVLKAVADALRQLSPLAQSDAPIFEVFTLRGGIPRERNLVADPAQPAVVLSTVDQVGSRLLFRGYGVSPRMSPIHAGMFGIDTVLFLDEAHIAEPFRKTVAGILREQGRAEHALGPKPLRFVQLSATLGQRAEIELTAADEANPVLSARLGAKKPMRVTTVGKRDEVPKEMVRLVDEELASSSLDDAEAPRIGVVVNRVATARATFSLLEKKLAGKAELALLIGQIRPLDRDALLGDEQTPGLSQWLASSDLARSGERPIVVVATQTIEVGADYDFHTLFTEGAPLSSLMQRCGRLNRLGRRPVARGAIVWCEESLKSDPIYGAELAETRALLREHEEGGKIGFGINELKQTLRGTTFRDGAREVAAANTPVLSPSILGLYTQTCPRPEAEPDVASYLHGFTEFVPEVHIVWRHGVRRDRDGVVEEASRLTIDANPPLSLEALRMRLADFRRWRAGKRNVGEADVDGVADPDADDGTPGGQHVLVVDSDGTRSVAPNQVQPGAVVVLSTRDGGVDRFGFDPGALPPSVEDQSQKVREKLGRSDVVVLAAAVVDDLLQGAQHGTSALLESFDEDDVDDVQMHAQTVEWLRESDHPVLQQLAGRVEPLTVVEALRSRRDGRRLVGLVFRAPKPTPQDIELDDDSLQRTRDVKLLDHCAGVGGLAKALADSVGLAGNLSSDLALAGRLHDLGKADPRFQALLGAAEGEPPLAKGRRRSRVNARFAEPGERHEAYSVSLMELHPELVAAASDADLVRLVVGTHHGHGRALHPARPDAGAAFTIEVDGVPRAHPRRAPSLGGLEAGWPDLFRRVERRYGAWGLAYLEAILRLADHRRSQMELEGT